MAGNIKAIKHPPNKFYSKFAIKIDFYFFINYIPQRSYLIYARYMTRV